MKHVVKQGECIESIALRHGHLWRTIWDDPQNQALRNKRKNPNVLMEGDVVYVPAIRPKWEKVQTGALHEFVRLGRASHLRIAIGALGSPRANATYKLVVDGREQARTTDGDGFIECDVPPNARRATVTFEEDGATFDLALGHLDPIDEPTGLRARLEALGYRCGQVGDGTMKLGIRLALRRFQGDHGLRAGGELDGATRAKLVEAFGC